MLGSEEHYDLAHFEFVMRAAARIRAAHPRLAEHVSVSLHCEMADILNAYTRLTHQDASLTGLAAYSAARPPHAEGLAVAVAAYLGHETGCVNVNLLHLSSRKALETALTMARAFPHVDFRREVTVGHLLLDVAAPAAAYAKVNPPIRPREDVEYLWKAVLDGHVDWIVSDHACCAEETKAAGTGAGDIWLAKSGFGGTEYLLAGVFSEGRRRGLPLSRVAALTSWNPARRYGLLTKGDLAPGFDADIALLDPDRAFTVRAADSPSAQGYTPFEGQRLTGQALAFEGRVALGRGRVGRPHRERAIRIEQRDVRVEAGREVALGEQAVAPRRVPRRERGHAGERQPAPAALAEDAGQQVFRPAEARLRQPDVAGARAGGLRLLGAAGVVADDPVHVTVEHRLPEIFDVLARTDRRVDLRVGGGRCRDVEQQVADRHLPAKVDVWEGARHRQRGLQRLAGRQVQQVDVDAARLVPEVCGHGDGEALGVGRPRRAVGGEAGERGVLVREPRVGVEDVGHLAVQADADVLGQPRVRRADPRRRAHHELEVREVVVILGADHQEAALLVLARRAVQAVAAIEHEDLERRHAVRGGEGLHLVEMVSGDGRQVITVVAVVATFRQLQDFGKEVRVAAAAIEVILAGAEIREHRGDAARDRGAALGDRVVGERRVDADVGVRVHHARKRESSAAVVDARRGARRDAGRDALDPAVAHAEIGLQHPRRGRTYDAHVLDDEVERGRRHRLPRVVEDHAERVAQASGDAAHAVAHGHAVDAARSLDGPVAGREHDDLALLGGDRLAARLRARALLDEQELAALVVDSAAAEEARQLQREHDLAIDVLVQAIVTAGLVAQQQRGRLRLAALVAAAPQRRQLGRKQIGIAERGLPLVGDRRQRRVRGLAQRLDQRRQRRVEILVLTDAETVAGHIDAAAEAALVVVQRHQLRALRRREHG